MNTSVNESDDRVVRERLEQAVGTAREAVLEVSATGVGEHAGTAVEAPFTVTHRFEAELPGYRGWRWECVLASVPGDPGLTVDEISLLPGPDALVAPEWIPWEKRIRAGDLGAGDLLPASEDDGRLVPGQLLTGDEEIDELAAPVGLGRRRHLSLEGRLEAATRWAEARGPESEIARGAEHHCGTCGFLVPLVGSLGSVFGVCANEYSADGAVVHLQYGCGAHSEVAVETEPLGPSEPAFDDAAVEVIVLPQQLAGASARRAASAGTVDADPTAPVEPDHHDAPGGGGGPDADLPDGRGPGEG